MKITNVHDAIEVIDRKIEANRKMINSYNGCNRRERDLKKMREVRLRDLNHKKRLLEFSIGNGNLYSTSL